MNNKFTYDPRTDKFIFAEEEKKAYDTPLPKKEPQQKTPCPVCRRRVPINEYDQHVIRHGSTQNQTHHGRK